MDGSITMGDLKNIKDVRLRKLVEEGTAIDVSSCKVSEGLYDITDLWIEGAQELSFVDLTLEKYIVSVGRKKDREGRIYGAIDSRFRQHPWYDELFSQFG
ncbi:MAG: hypothetical protein KGH64_04335 [Candidatus Micrarchaeota archaeon]|nr:hypothetical protein [Candidatus Micrarchaeota archaeon]